MSPEIRYQKHCVKVILRGEYRRFAQCQQALDNLITNALPQEPAVLWDARGASVHLSAADFCRLAMAFGRSIRSQRRERRVAVLLNEPTCAALFLILKNLMVGRPVRYRLFRDEVEASAWLRFDPDPPRLRCVQ